MTHVTGETIWKTHEGRKIRLKDLSDIHLANIVHYLKKEDSYDEPRVAVLKYLCVEAYKRGLSNLFMKRAPYPFRDTSNRWKLWTAGEGFQVLQR